MTDQKVSLYNPLDTDFTYTWLDDLNKPHELIMPAGRVTYFPKPQADFMTKHLLDELININKVKAGHELVVKKYRDLITKI